MPDLYCPKCEYNLTGLTENRCPECGSEFDWAQIKKLADESLKPISLPAVILYTIVPPIVCLCLMYFIQLIDFMALDGLLLAFFLVFALINAGRIIQRLQVKNLISMNRPVYSQKNVWPSLIAAFVLFLLQIAIAVALGYFLLV